MPPGHFVGGRVGADVTLEVDVIALANNLDCVGLCLYFHLFQVARIDGRTEVELNVWRD